MDKKEDCISVIDLSDESLVVVKEPLRLNETLTNGHICTYFCNHVSYDTLPPHLGNHHQKKYTFSKTRRKDKSNIFFDHKFHHQPRNHKKIFINKPDVIEKKIT